MGSTPTGRTMEILALDTETHRFRAGCMAPRIVCVQYAWGDTSLVEHRDAARDHVAQALAGRIVGHNIAYDMACVCSTWPELTGLVFQAYSEDRITDTMIRQWLIDTATGDFDGMWYDFTANPQRGGKIGYGLKDTAFRLLGVDLEKDAWRTGYGELDAVPFEQWPEGAIKYAREDAVTTLRVFEHQEQHAVFLEDQYRQARAYWWLHLSRVWGPIVDQAKVDQLENQWRAAYESTAAELVAAGLKRPSRVKRDGTAVEGARDTKAVEARITEAFGGLVPNELLTPTGKVKTDEDTCRATGDYLLGRYADFGSLKHKLSTDLPLLRAAGSNPIHARYGWAVSGRTTCKDPNLQNTPREKGVKECFVPRPGCVFAIIDAGGLELATMAQAWVDLLGHSRLAEAIRDGKDPHLIMASAILGIPYDVALSQKKDHRVKDARQTGKVANFGFPGGLGTERLVEFARKLYGVILTPEQAKELKALWTSSWPEAREFFRVIDAAVTTHGSIVQVRSMRVRGGVGFTDACNTMFQGLGADTMKDLGWRIASEQYLGDGPLAGSRTVVFEHDAFIVEVPEDRGHDAAMRLEALMAEVGRDWLPDVKLGGECALSRYWTKDPERVFRDGRLVAP